MPAISVIIPCLNGESMLEGVLQAVRKSDFKDYELIVVDDGSRDRTREIALKYADKVLSHEKNQGVVKSRVTGFGGSAGKIILNMDADVIVFPDTLGKVWSFFQGRPDVSAVTGVLSKQHPNKDFFSQYKNLYMNYIFMKLPEQVNFLYGSIHAVRREDFEIYDTGQKLADDTERGQRLAAQGKKIAFLNELEVIHLKQYSFKGWMKNDYSVPFWWARLFVLYQGWKNIGKNKGGYLHSPKEQLASVVIGPLSVVFLTAGIFWHGLLWTGLILKLTWLLLNLDFIVFLWKERGAWFGMRSILATYLDHMIMAWGIFSGMINACVKSQS